MHEQEQTSTRESAQDILLGCLRLWKNRNGTELRYQAGKRQVNEPKAACEQPVIPVHSRKLAGESKAKGLRASLLALERLAISSREEVASGWRQWPSRWNPSLVRRNNGARVLDRASGGLRDGQAWRILCGAPNRIADKSRPTFPCKCHDVFSQGWRRPRWRCCGRRL